MERKYRIVILDCPFDTWKSETTRKIFCEMVQLKQDGYCGLYPNGVVPISDSDFVSTHKLVCLEENDELIPMISSHSISVECAREHSLAFPALGLVKACGTSEHVKVVSEIMSRCEEQGRTLSYDAGWTISPRAREDRLLHIEVQRIFRALHTFYLMDYKIDEVIAAAATRFNVERSCKFWGYKAITVNGSRLPEVPVSKFYNEPTILLHLEKLDPKAIEASQAYRKYWDERIVIAKSIPADPKRSAA